ncbi:hypothetical protein [Acinetobacter bereziniae]|uniref:hypothetical protein n=1 Tax=Acinetobacter bereziniae TaxID=106648 RepID=UPI00073E8C34|nr:hypothetical protein [Acinetobacter bereziniae]RSZ28165.1 hypothetical protein NDM229_020415 [Acinetobacter bereziniae]
MMGKFKRYTYSIIIIFLFGSLLTACHPRSKNIENNSMNQQTYILHFGPQGVQDFSKYNDGQVDHQPAGASFRELDFSPPNLGQVKIENSSNSLVIDHVFSVLGTQWSSNDGIQIFDIDAGLNKEEFVNPEQAYQGYVELMKRLNQAQWKVYFLRDEARIAKQDNIPYLAEGRNIIDPTYIFNFEEWTKIINSIPASSLGYRLYANGIYLDISLNRTKKNKDGKEQYIVRYSFQTVRYNERNLMSDTDKMTPQELENAFKQSLIKDKRYREQEERKAISKGYHIDESYIDPDVWLHVK